jgi:hemoglobin-like flavoprotein
MTSEQIRLIRSSFGRLISIAEPAAALFYAELFKADPSLQAMFKGDMKQQGVKLMQMIGSAVGLLDKPQLLMPVLRQLGRRHGGYGVQQAHYDSVGVALLQTLEQGLGDAFDEPTRTAWAAMYALVSQLMIEAAAAPQEAVAA